MSTNWTKLTREQGYPTEAAMLDDLYTNQGLSLGEIADRLGVGKMTARLRLKHFNIPVRRRGGDTNGTPPARNILFHIDQRIVWSSTLEELKQLTGCSWAAISNYKNNARRS